MVYYIGTLPVSPYLEHFGILGMKWGVRRYQNEDGSLTPEGTTKYRPASKRETKILENLNRIKNEDKSRMSRMSARQKRSLNRDIDFYTKRTTGEVKAKNAKQRQFDELRSKKFKDRAISMLGQSAITALAQTGMMLYATKEMGMKMPTGKQLITRTLALTGGLTLANIGINEAWAKIGGTY